MTEVRPDPEGGWWVTRDGVPQSFVDPADPDHLRLGFLHAIAALAAASPPGPLDVVHVGGAGLALLRHLEARRSGSRHVVVEPDAALTEVVLAALPLPGSTDVTHLAVDGRSGLADLEDDSADLVVVDAFVGDRVPGSLLTLEASGGIARVLRAGGRLVLNLGDGPDHGFARRVVATLRVHLPSLVAVGRPPVVAGRGYGNLVLGAARTPWDEEALARRLAGLPVELAVLGRAALASYDGEVLRDADPQDSPSLADFLPGDGG